MKHSPAFLALVEQSRARIREVSAQEVAARLAQGGGEPFHLIDVREDHEWAQDRARGARHLGKGILERDIEAAIPDKQAEIVLYCGGGFRSALAADALQQMGYTRVRSMAGGIKAWRELQLPLES